MIEILSDRIRADPFNLVATGIFFLAVVHTFLAPLFIRLSRTAAAEHERTLADQPRAQTPQRPAQVSFKAEILHFLGEVEAIFGIWVIPLLIALSLFKGWPAARDYLEHGPNFTEPFFVVVVMTIAASRPILNLAERAMALAAKRAGGSPAAWWFSILTLGPVLGSLITEPAAMTISALLLGRAFYSLRPGAGLAYGTLGLLFVNISVGGTLTHFAAPPVLMVAGKWGWSVREMFFQFGWKAVTGILVSNLVYLAWFRHDFKAMSTASGNSGRAETESVPVWITMAHLVFLVWTVLNAHYPVLFIGGFLFYLAFTEATEHHQSELSLRPALLVGFFLAGLVVHGGLQGWWIEPVLGRLTEVPLFCTAAGLTAFNDNAAITYLATLVPNLGASLKYAVVAGAMAGGGLTVIANAPNPAGQSILAKYFPGGISAGRLFLGALVPTLILSILFLLIR